jgi:hypothetical protein
MMDAAVSVEKDALEETRKELVANTGKVDRIIMAAFGGDCNNFSNREFCYHLIARVEQVFESSLTIMIVLFSGASLVAELFLSQLKENNHNHIREQAMRSMLPRAGTTEVELKEVLHSYVLRT